MGPMLQQQAVKQPEDAPSFPLTSKHTPYIPKILKTIKERNQAAISSIPHGIK